jgi:hypothetical protein
MVADYVAAIATLVVTVVTVVSMVVVEFLQKVVIVKNRFIHF